MIKKISVVMILAIAIFACKPSMKTTSAWTNRHYLDSAQTRGTYKTIFIAVISNKLEARVELEGQLAAAAEAHGYKAIKSLDKIPQIVGQKPPREIFLDIIRKSGADAILTTAIVDQKSETKYVSGSNSPTVGFGVYGGAYPSYYGSYGGYYGGYGGFYNYYGSAWDLYSSSGYYTEDKTYYMESNLFDMKTGAMIWSVHIKAKNPEDIEKSSKKYTELTVKQLQDDGLLKK